MQLHNTQQRWGIVSVCLHWLTAITVVGLFILGLWMVELTYYDRWYNEAPFIHKSIGILLFVLTMVRLVWRYSHETPVAIASHTVLERKAARAVVVIIYLLLLTVMISGYLISTADGRGIDVFGWFEIPATVYGYNQQEDIAGAVHLVLAISLISLVVVHAVAALKHHFIDKDRTLLRMLGK
ncbi:MAG: cytochrome b [Thioalkalispiraceae bacterium]|jgi:cytochrome b561